MAKSWQRRDNLKSRVEATVAYELVSRASYIRLWQSDMGSRPVPAQSLRYPSKSADTTNEGSIDLHGLDGIKGKPLKLDGSRSIYVQTSIWVDALVVLYRVLRRVPRLGTRSTFSDCEASEHIAWLRSDEGS